MIHYLNFKSVDASNIKSHLISISYKSVLDGYTSYDIDPKSKIYQEIVNIFPEDKRKFFKKICVQTILPTWNDYIHKDPRDIAINFLLNLGGDNVLTSFYNDDNQLIYEETIDIHKWHWFSTKTNHCIKNISGRRAAISLSVENPDEDFLKWLELNSI